MKWTTKNINVIQSIGCQLIIPAPFDNEISTIDSATEYTVEVKKKRKKRSLSANAYCWVLCQRIAEELSKNGYIDKERVYRKAIKESQPSEIIGIASDKVEDFKRKWQHNGIGWFVEVDEEERMKGITRLYVYAGSSSYNTAEMSRLIECLIDECQQLNIPLEPTEEIQALLDEWSV